MNTNLARASFALAGVAALVTGCAERPVAEVPVYHVQPVYVVQQPSAPPVTYAAPSAAGAGAPTSDWQTPAAAPPTAPPQPAPAQPVAAPPPQHVVVAPALPPPPRVEIIPTAPGPYFVWTSGYWAWRGGWVWVNGCWVHRPRPTAVWVGGHWTRHGHGYVWVGGGWR